MKLSSMESLTRKELFNSSSTGNATHLYRTPGGSPTFGAHETDDNHNRAPIAATATATVTPRPAGVAQRQMDMCELQPSSYLDEETDEEESSLDLSSTASDDTQPQRLEEDFPHFNLDIDIPVIPPAPSSQTWASHNHPLLSDYATRQINPPLAKRVSVQLNEPTQFMLGIMQMLPNRNPENLDGVHPTRILPPQLLENYVDILSWAKEYFRARFGHVDLDNNVAVLLTVITNNFYEAHIRLIDMISKRALENMDRRHGIQVDVADFAFGVDLEMSQELPFLATANLRVRETLESLRPKVVEPPKQPYATRFGRETKAPPKGALTLQELKAAEEERELSFMTKDSIAEYNSSVKKAAQKNKKLIKTATQAAAESSAMAVAEGAPETHNDDNNRITKKNVGRAGAPAALSTRKATVKKTRGRPRGSGRGRGRGRGGAARAVADEPSNPLPSVPDGDVAGPSTALVEVEAPAGDFTFHCALQDPADAAPLAENQNEGDEDATPSPDDPSSAPNLDALDRSQETCSENPSVLPQPVAVPEPVSTPTLTTTSAVVADKSLEISIPRRSKSRAPASATRPQTRSVTLTANTPQPQLRPDEPDIDISIDMGSATATPLSTLLDTPSPVAMAMGEEPSTPFIRFGGDDDGEERDSGSLSLSTMRPESVIKKRKRL